jgi:hypothetical protein
MGDMTPTQLADDAFGDRFDLSTLPLPRRAAGYAVQRLNTDTLLDRQSAEFLPVRSPLLSGLFASFDEAHAAASRWLEAHEPKPDDHGLAIVPANFDAILQRHVLIYGVLRGQP